MFPGEPGWLIYHKQNLCLILVHHPGASRHLSWPGGEIDRTDCGSVLITFTDLCRRVQRRRVRAAQQDPEPAPRVVLEAPV